VSESAPRPDRSWVEAGIAASLSAVVFAIYALGACPTIYVGDSGELVTAVATLGIPHPSGYPLYVLLGKLFTLLVPAGSIAFRMSLFSAAFGATTAGLLYRLGREVGLGRPSAALSGLLFAFCPSVWAEANVQRVYTLNAFFVVLATLWAFRWFRTRRDGTLVMAFFIVGLGATNHTFMAVYAIGLVIWAISVDPVLLKRGGVLLRSGVSFAVGLLPYVYLPLRSRANPRLDWGNPETLGNFLHVVTRRDFWDRKWITGPLDLIPITADWARSLGTETLWVGAFLSAVGVLAALLGRRRSLVLLPLVVMAGNLGAMALHGSRTDLFIWHRYYIPSYAMLAVLAGWGAQALAERLPPKTGVGLLVLPLVLCIHGYRSQDRHRYRVAEDFSETVLNAIPPGGHLSASDDNILFVLMYLHIAERKRPDLDLILQGVGGAELQPLHFEPETDPIFFTDHPNWNLPELEIVGAGVVFRPWRRGKPFAPAAITKWELDGETDPAVPKDYLTQNLIGHFHYMLGVTLERTNWPKAREQYDVAARASPYNDVLFYNLGLIFRGHGLVDEALAAFKRSRENNPREILNPKHPRAVDRVTEMEAEKARLGALEKDLALDPIARQAAPGTEAYHLRLATLCGNAGETAAAEGHRLRALEARARRSEPAR
jgi:Protein of unknown function (DUF2723)